MEEMRRSDALSAEEVERHKLTQCEHLARQAMHIVHEESGERDTLHQTEDQAYKELQWVVSRERDALTRKDAEDIALRSRPFWCVMTAIRMTAKTRWTSSRKMTHPNF